MRGVFHVSLHAYYVLLALFFLYGDTLATLESWQELAAFLGGLPLVEVFVAVALFIDVSRAPDCDISCRGTALGYVAYLLVKPFAKPHRGWYHSVWAAIYVASLSTVLLTPPIYALQALALFLGAELRFSIYRVASAAFSASFLSYCLHLIEDSLTKRGVDWFGYRVRGPATTGTSDFYVTALLVATSAGGILVTYSTTRALGISALLGLVVLLIDFALLITVRRKPRT